jgi:RHS repeat-associated protein
LGNILATITDAKIYQTNGSLAKVISGTDYYAFGAAMPSRSYQDAGYSKYRYGFNGKENDEDIGEGVMDFGERLQNTKVGRWTTIDPLADKYASLSPYAYVANSPIQAIDPDGRLIIFVNGLRMGASDSDQGRVDVINGFLWALQLNPNTAFATAAFRYFTNIGAEIPIQGVWKTDIFGSLPGTPYWSTEKNSLGENVSMSQLFMDRVGDQNAWYTSGSAERGSKANSRYDDGIAKADEIHGMIASGEIKMETGESIKIVAHSQGCAHAAGIATRLQELQYKVEIVYYVNPHQPTDIAHPTGVTGKQYSYYDDAISSEMHKDYFWFKYLNGDSTFGNIPNITEFWHSMSFPKKDVNGNYVTPTGVAGNRNNHNVNDNKHIISIPQTEVGYVEPRRDN